MKLVRRESGNRHLISKELLLSPEEPEAAWGPADISMAREFLSNWEANAIAAPNLVKCLDILVPGTVTPEQREGVAEDRLSKIHKNIKLIGNPRVNAWNFLLSDIGDLLKIDPAARKMIPEMNKVNREIARPLENVDTFSETTESPLLVAYTLFEPKGKKISQAAWEKMMNRARKYWESGGHNTQAALQLLSMARILFPERFSAHPPPQDVVQRLLHESKKVRLSTMNSYSFSTQLLDVLVLAGDEVAVTERDGLQVRFLTQKIASGQQLPDRSML